VAQDEWDGIDRRSLEARMGQIEREMSAYAVLLERHNDILAKIEKKLDEPARIPEWIAASVAAMALFGGILYAAFIAPLDNRLEHMQRQTELLGERITTNKQLFLEILHDAREENRNSVPAEPVN